MPAARPFSKDDILRAMRYTKSNRSAARYIGCSYIHYKMYASLYKNEDTGETLFQQHMNRSGKGIPKFLPNKKRQPNVKLIIETGTGWESFTIDKIKKRLITEGYLKEECYRCGFGERRITDYKMPLLLSFKDGLKHNWLHDNLEMLCYNCYFLYITDPLSPDQIRSAEDNAPAMAPSFKWDLDDDQLENMRLLGIKV